MMVTKESKSHVRPNPRLPGIQATRGEAMSKNLDFIWSVKHAFIRSCRSAHLLTLDPVLEDKRTTMDRAPRMKEIGGALLIVDSFCPSPFFFILQLREKNKMARLIRHRVAGTIISEVSGMSHTRTKQGVSPHFARVPYHIGLIDWL